MRFARNDKGSVLVFVTVMIVLLMVMIGMGLDTGHLVYVRSLGQTAVDAAALAAASGLPVSQGEVQNRAAGFNSTNNYLNSPNNLIDNTTISYVQYDPTSQGVTNTSFSAANGVRVALEKANPYTSTTTNKGIVSPLFLTPLLNLFGAGPTAGTRDVGVSAVAALVAEPSIPIAVYQSVCNGTNTVPNVQLLTAPATTDNSCWTTYWSSPASAQTIQDLFVNTPTCSSLPKSSGGSGPITLNNGVATNPVYGAAHTLFSASSFTQCWIIPVVPAGSPCNGTDPIVDWAKICPSAVIFPGGGGGGGGPNCPNGNNGTKCIMADVTCGQSLHRKSDSLCFSPRLVRENSVGM